MQLQVSEIKESGAELEIEESASHFSALADLEQGGVCTFLSPVVVTLNVHKISGMVEIQGRIATEVEIPCKRCLAPTQRNINASFHQTYVDELPQVSGDDGEELELSAAEMGLELFTEGCIDITEEIQQQVLLLLPDHPLCDEQCKGLCLECGVNLNSAQCNCADAKVSINFAVLKDFKVEK
ncbi:MAG: hypothetical protein BA874_08250 [Desulfuromonadales bacterium C00003068]|jgi:uncharacterized protein|nr:MAG: hypothetical protein BA874_08250 [Desulfuromonadales bacterium C00003068]